MKAQRKYSALATPEVRQELERLLNKPSVAQYRDAMKRLGQHLGAVTSERLDHRRPFALVTTPEDADFLTRGMLSQLPRTRAHLVCYWTTRHTFSDRAGATATRDVATVTQSFVDPSMPKTLEAVVIAKSIIASGCVVRSHLEKFLAGAKPQHILIAAPVMLRGAEDQLRADFSDSISRRFEFVTFAMDSLRQGATVEPGIGGQVEERLGLEGKHRSPDLVKEWRSSLHATAHAPA